jgi:cell division septal protein FtsQ
MTETVTIRDGKFLRPSRKEEEKGGVGFQRILKKFVRVAFQLLLLSFLLFISHRLYVHLLEDPFFQVREIEVKGCRKMEESTILSLIKMEGMPNLFTVSLKEVAKRLETHPWIEEVKARKVFPNKILIQIEERKPIAILQLEESYYIDTKGVIFSPVGDRDELNYPFLTGLTKKGLERDPIVAKDLIMKALEFLRIAEKERISPLEEISEIHMEKIFGIKCFTRAEGVEVRMGWDHFGEKLRRLSLIWSDLQKRGISVSSIDCNDLKRVVVKKTSRKGN